MVEQRLEQTGVGAKPVQRAFGSARPEEVVIEEFAEGGGVGDGEVGGVTVEEKVGVEAGREREDVDPATEAGVRGNGGERGCNAQGEEEEEEERQSGGGVRHGHGAGSDLWLLDWRFPIFMVWAEVDMKIIHGCENIFFFPKAQVDIEIIIFGAS